MHPGGLRAIGYMIAAVAAFAVMDALLKLLAAHYPPMEVAVLRGAASLPFMLLPLLVSGRWQQLRPRRWYMHLLRGALSVVVLGGFIYAVRVLSLANAYAVFLSAPLMVTALSVPLLKERADPRNWIAIGLGLVGVLTILRPGTSGLTTLGTLAALISAVAYAMSAIAVRVLTRTDTTAAVVFWTVSLMTLFSAGIAAPEWVSLEHAHWRYLVALGVLAAVAQYLLTEAFRSAPLFIVAPFEYTSLLWGIAIDRLVWHVLPSMRVCVGGGLVIASGLYLIWHERPARGAGTFQQSWKWTAWQGRMSRRSSTVDASTVEDGARKQEEDSP